MHVIWKRPDGFQNAMPEDFRRVTLSNGTQLWLHRHEKEWYPFQVSGDWSGQLDTKRLNQLVNMIDASDECWKSFLKLSLDNEIENSCLNMIARKNFDWLKTFEKAIKGDTWEIEIVRCALQDVLKKIAIYCE